MIAACIFKVKEMLIDLSDYHAACKRCGISFAEELDILSEVFPQVINATMEVYDRFATEQAEKMGCGTHGNGVLQTKGG